MRKEGVFRVLIFRPGGVYTPSLSTFSRTHFRPRIRRHAGRPLKPSYNRYHGFRLPRYSPPQNNNCTSKASPARGVAVRRNGALDVDRVMRDTAQPAGSGGAVGAQDRN